MEIPKPNRISADNFKKTLGGSQGYVSAAQTKALRQAGLGGILYKKNISRDEALKAVKILQNQGHLSKIHSGSDIFSRAANLQKKQLQIKEDIKQGHLRNYLAMDVDEQMRREEMENDFIKYPKRSFSSVAERIEYENNARAAKVNEENQKRSRLYNSQVKPKSPSFMSVKDLNID